jgi:hypothetical protein
LKVSEARIACEFEEIDYVAVNVFKEKMAKVTFATSVSPKPDSAVDRGLPASL